MRNGTIKASVVIPVYNNRAGLERVLQAIDHQTYPKEEFEVIIVDNGSDDSPEEIANRHKDRLNIHFLEERNHLHSPYSARNRGIEISKGEIIILLDSTCAPVEDWISEGIRMIDGGADLVGGEVSFDINESSSVGEIYDSLSNVRMKYSIEKHSAAKGGNLFIRKKVFEDIGLFPEGLRSGGDVRWTNKASQAGYKLLYSAEARVIIKPRGLFPLIRKQYRVAKGQPAIWKESGKMISNLGKKVVLGWLPPNPATIWKWIQEQKDKPYIKNYFFQIYFTGWLLRVINASGNMKGMIRLLVAE